MKGIQEAVKSAKLKLFDPEEIREAGRRAYRMIIPREHNPRRSDTERKLWEAGWDDAKSRWVELMRRNGGHLW